MESIVAHPDTGPTLQFASAVDSRVGWRLRVGAAGEWPLRADSVAKVVLLEVSKILRAVGAVFV